MSRLLDLMVPLDPGGFPYCGLDTIGRYFWAGGWWICWNPPDWSFLG